ncbi:MAG: sigma-70 family RNA polymerase sigma factor [Clostridia bacterium]|nr:sigma-70 family RNA polymerase sigma factor [Clostridia bacterium]
MYGKVEICGVNTAKLQILKESEKRELLIKAHNGDKSAREKLINGNLRLVLRVIQSFKNRNENPDDLFQVGCIGLIKAIDNFDPNLDVKFSTYAVPMIIGELRRFLRDYNSIRVPRSLRDIAYKSLKAKESLSNKLSHDPSIEEIAN